MLADDLVETVSPLELVEVVAGRAQACFKPLSCGDDALRRFLDELSVQKFVNRSTFIAFSNESLLKESLEFGRYCAPDVFVEFKSLQVRLASVAASHEHVQNGAYRPYVIVGANVVITNEFWGKEKSVNSGHVRETTGVAQVSHDHWNDVGNLNHDRVLTAFETLTD